MNIDSFEYEVELAKKSLAYVMNKIVNSNNESLEKWMELGSIFISKDINDETSYVTFKVKDNNETNSHVNFEINKFGELTLLSPISFIHGENLPINPSISNKFIMEIQNV